jgi:hypothetical protein
LTYHGELKQFDSLAHELRTQELRVGQDKRIERLVFLIRKIERPDRFPSAVNAANTENLGKKKRIEKLITPKRIAQLKEKAKQWKNDFDAIDKYRQVTGRAHDRGLRA